MIGRLFAPLASKIFGGIAALLLVALTVTWMGKKSAERQAQALRARLAAAGALLAAQNAGIESLEAQSERARQASARALAAARRESRAGEVTAVRIEAARPLSGRCETPADVREADL